MKNDIQAFIFDLDGVIIDTAKYHYLSWKRLCKTFGYDFKVADNEPLKGASRMHSLEMILDLAQMEKSQEAKEKLCALKNEWYLESIQSISKNDLLPGVAELMQSLRRAGMKQALGSASRNARRILELIGIEDQFDVIVDGNDVVAGKPDPAVFLLAAERLGMDPSACVVIEDAAKGVTAAKRAGMMAIGVGNARVLDEADHVLEDLRQTSYRSICHLLNHCETS